MSRIKLHADIFININEKKDYLVLRQKNLLLKSNHGRTADLNFVRQLKGTVVIT